MTSDPTAIDVRFTRNQAAIIWPGLNFIVNAHLTRITEGRAVTSYPFYLFPLPPTADLGIWSQRLMQSIVDLLVEFKPRARSGGRFQMSILQLWIIAYAARLGIKLFRKDIKIPHNCPKRDSRRWKRQQAAYSKLKLDTRGLITSLERLMKRASRHFLKLRARSDFTALGVEWRGHLRWMKLNLTYLDPQKLLKRGSHKGQRLVIDEFVALASEAILIKGYGLPESRALRRVMRMYKRYWRRGRRPEIKTSLFRMGLNSRSLREAIFSFVSARLQLRERTVP
ncbi:MAG TPA: hypothetical protein VHX60_13855 [Acidobacteriaceae bacterium]|nr:hypothetical protein [Acidobacteriaceae bacterium]